MFSENKPSAFLFILHLTTVPQEINIYFPRIMDYSYTKELIITSYKSGHTMRLDRGQIEVVDDAMAEVLRRKTPAERIQIGFTLWTSAYNMLMTHLKKTHPDWTKERIEQEVAKRLSHGAV